MELSLLLDAKADRSLQVQIFEQIRKMILGGQLKSGMALPPSRILSDRFAISRNTVTIAYDRLVAEGYVESRGTAGIFVSPIVPDDLFSISGDRAQSNGPLPDETGEPLLCFAGSPGGGDDRAEADFWVGRSDPASFPHKIWRKIVNRRLSGDASFLTDYCDPAGIPDLREAIAGHLGRVRGMSVTSDQIIVTGGGQDALNLINQLVSSETSQLCIENPCYQGAAMLFQSVGRPVIPISIDSEGIEVANLPKTPGSLLYVTPSHQFPTGVMLPLNRRLALLRWAEETDSYIVEDDYDSDFRYDGPPLMALAGLDRCRRVFYVGTFSKSVGAGLRLGYAALPRLYWEKARLLKAQMSNGQPWLEQAALTDFIQDGHFERHLRKTRLVYKARRDCLVAALNANFDNPRITGAESGLHFVWHLPEGSPPARTIQLAARSIGVGVYANRSGAAFNFDEQAPDDALMFGYSSLKEPQIEKAIKSLRDVFRNLGAIAQTRF